MTETKTLRVEVAYALPEKQQLLSLQVEEGCTAYEAVKLSGILEQFPEIDIESAKLGIFGKAIAKPKATELVEGDRVEIYRALIADPKEVRKTRAAKVKAEKAAAKAGS